MCRLQATESRAPPRVPEVAHPTNCGSASSPFCHPTLPTHPLVHPALSATSGLHGSNPAHGSHLHPWTLLSVGEFGWTSSASRNPRLIGISGVAPKVNRQDFGLLSKSVWLEMGAMLVKSSQHPRDICRRQASARAQADRCWQQLSRANATAHHARNLPETPLHVASVMRLGQEELSGARADARQWSTSPSARRSAVGERLLQPILPEPVPLLVCQIA